MVHNLDCPKCMERLQVLIENDEMINLHCYKCKGSFKYSKRAKELRLLGEQALDNKED